MKHFFDLTQTLKLGCPDWDGCCGFHMDRVYEAENGPYVDQLKIPNGIGTHIDAPLHFIKAGTDISELPLTQLIAPGVVIDVRDKVAVTNVDYAITIDDICAFEACHGIIAKGCWVICQTGWSAKWAMPQAYRNVDQYNQMHFPKLSPEAANYLLERKITGIAVDTLSPDGGDLEFPVHHILLSNNILIMENIYIPDKLPANNFQLCALPLKIKDATEAPCRVVAF